MIPNLENDKRIIDANICWNKIMAKLQDKDVVNKSKLFAWLPTEDSVNIFQLEYPLREAEKVTSKIMNVYRRQPYY